MLKKAGASLSVASLVMAALVVTAPSALAHCPSAPYDNTVFAPIDDSGTRIGLEMLAGGLAAPLKGVVAPGQPDRLFVVDQKGTLWAINVSTGAKSVFLDVSSRLVPIGVLGPNTIDERGFLGVVFHPAYQVNGKLYTYTSEPVSGPPTFPSTIPPGHTADHQNVLAEWRVPNPGNPASVVDPSTRRELFRGDWPQFNHDGGDLAFGPDSMLYISMGDGGGADDTDGQLFIKATGGFPVVIEPIIGHQGNGNAQKLNTNLGKILRIDVNGTNSANGQYGIPADNPFRTTPGAVAEIYAYGLRNPYRFSFDFATGALLAGDAGQNDIEEVDVIEKGGNYGWNYKEGTPFFDPKGNDPGVATLTDPGRIPPGTSLIDPIAQYDTHHEGHSVIGGFVYHGSRIPQLRGRYVFGDFARLFKFPFGPHNFGRLFYLGEKHPEGELLTIKEFHGFRESLEELGLIVDTHDCFPNTLAVLGWGQDANGELYVLGNISGVASGTGGVVLRLAPVARRR